MQREGQKGKNTLYYSWQLLNLHNAMQQFTANNLVDLILGEFTLLRWSRFRSIVITLTIILL
jgi:hypothetical protein